jgi:integrase/recombinase XerD
MTSLEDAHKEFILQCVANGLAQSTIRWYGWTLAPMIQALHNRQLDSVTRSEMRRYVASLREREARFQNHHNRPELAGGLSAASVAAYIVAALRFWAWAAGEYRIENPMQGIKKPKLRNKTPKAIDAADFVRLFEQSANSLAPERDRLLLAFLADTGCRRGSLPNIKIRDVDLARRCCYVTEKSGRSRWIYWTEYTNQLIRRWLDVHPDQSGWLFCAMGDGRIGDKMTPSGIYQILRRLKRAAGVRGKANPHSFRHNFARMYLQSGGDAITLAKFLGHSDPRTTADHYAIFSIGELGAMHDEHSPLLRILDIEGVKHS